MTKKAQRLVKSRGLKKCSLTTEQKVAREALVRVVNEVSNAQVRADAGIDINWKWVAEKQKESAQTSLEILTGKAFGMNQASGHKPTKGKKRILS